MKYNSKIFSYIFLFIFCILSNKTDAQDSNKVKTVPGILNIDEAKVIGEDFINKVLMQGVSKVMIKYITEEHGLYKYSVAVNGQEGVSYMSKDGKIFFITGMDMDQEMKKYIEERIPVKADKPKVELFIMSYCPFGTQIEKGMLPVLEMLGKKIDFELKFCSYAMHEQKELNEEMREYCLQKQKPRLFTDYLKCFLEEGKSEECLTKLGIDTVELKNQMAVVDTQYKVTETYNNKSKWASSNYPDFNIYKEDNTRYNVQGSPTLVMNGKIMPSGRDPQSLFELICSGFNDPPKECKTKLSTAIPSPGFGFTAKEGDPAMNQEGKCTAK